MTIVTEKKVFDGCLCNELEHAYTLCCFYLTFKMLIMLKSRCDMNGIHVECQVSSS